jgi:thiamine-phosphate pyrophosphorylase
VTGPPLSIRGFYAVLDLPAAGGRDAAELAELLVRGGATVLQVRAKRATTRQLVDVCRLVRRLTAAAGIPLVVNDRLDVALAVGADAVHLGQDDLPLAAARQAIARAGGVLAVGISTHDVEQARAAARAGADYLGFGPIYQTSSKERPDPVQGADALAAAVRAAAPVPVVAIGGITPARAREIAAAGAAAACAIASVNGAPDVVAAARAVAEAFR